MWRIAKSRFATDLSGNGAALYGGRWNHLEHHALYFGMSPAICALETFVHATQVPQFSLQLVSVGLPADESLYWEPSINELPAGWNSKPADRPSMDFGTAWLQRGQQLGLIVPSSVLTLERNIMINPGHPAASRIKVLQTVDFSYDSRLFTPRG